MAHFCETFDAGAGRTFGIGFDTTWSVRQGHYQMVDNKLWPDSCNFPNTVRWATDTDGDDQFMRMEIDKLGNQGLVGLMLRVVDFFVPGREWYQVGYANFGSPLIEIVKYKANVFSSLCSQARTFTSGDVLKGTVEGNVISAYVRAVGTTCDVLVCQVIDNDIPTSKIVGLHTFQSCTIPFGDVEMDNAWGGDLAEQFACEPVVVDEPGGANPPPNVRLVCGAPFTPNPCSQECPPEPSSTGVHVAPTDAIAFLSPLWFLGLAGEGTNGVLGRPSACGPAFTHAIPDEQTCTT